MKAIYLSIFGLFFFCCCNVKKIQSIQSEIVSDTTFVTVQTIKSKENELQIDTAGQGNSQIADTLRLINPPKVDTIINAIDEQIKAGDVNPEDLIK